MDFTIEKIQALDKDKVYVVEVNMAGAEIIDHISDCFKLHEIQVIFVIEGTMKFINVPEGYEIKKIGS